MFIHGAQCPVFIYGGDMSGYITKNPQELKDAILRRLGAPVINIEVTEDQIYDCIQRALELYGEYHFDGVNKGYKVFHVSEEQAQHGVFDLSDQGVFAVTQIIRTNVGSAATMDGSAVYPWFTDFLLGLAGVNGGLGSGCSKFYGPNAMGGDLGYFSQLMSYRATMQNMLNPLPDYWYNSTNGQLKVTGNFRAGDLIVAEVYVKSYIDVPDMMGAVAGYAYAGGCSAPSGGISAVYDNPRDALSGVVAGMGSMRENTHDAYNNRWVKDMATAFTKEVWGGIMAKHQGLQLPGGVTVDGIRLIEEARADIEKLRAELELLDPPFGILMI